MVPSWSTMPAAPTPSARASGRCGARSRTALAIPATISSSVGGLATRRSSTMLPSGSTSATRRLVPPRSTPKVGVSPTVTRLSLAAALLADHAVGRLDDRLGCVEQRVGRLEYVVLHLRDRTQQLGEDALEDRRGRQRPRLHARVVKGDRVG